MPTVSIVVPVYNSEKFLEQCMDSLIGQSFSDTEILCVNDGSSDNSLQILEGYALRDDRIRVFTKKNEGKGAASARNMGMDHATGKYILFLDSDDFFEKNMLELLVSKAEKTGADVVITRANCFDHKKQCITMPYRSINLQYAPTKEVFDYRDCVGHIFQMANNVNWNKLYRRDFLMKHQLRFEAIPISDDQYVSCLAMVLAKRLAVVDLPLINYRIHSGTNQVATYHKHPTSAYIAAYSIVDKLREYGVYDDVKQSYLNMELALMRVYLDRMRNFESMRMLYDIYRKEVFRRLGAENLEEDFFYDKRLAIWYCMIKEESLEEILFSTAKAYGCEEMTAIRRFPLPYEKIERNSKVVLVGKGIAGRYWMAQIALTGYCDVVAWVKDKAELSANLSYDVIIRAE